MVNFFEMRSAQRRKMPMRPLIRQPQRLQFGQRWEKLVYPTLSDVLISAIRRCVVTVG
jgi:hypothetical protein